MNFSKQVQRLNNFTGNPTLYYGKAKHHTTGDFKANIGHYYVEGCEQGYCLLQVVNESGGARRVFPYSKPKALAKLIDAYLDGWQDCLRKETGK